MIPKIDNNNEILFIKGTGWFPSSIVVMTAKVVVLDDLFKNG